MTKDWRVAVARISHPKVNHLTKTADNLVKGAGIQGIQLMTRQIDEWMCILYYPNKQWFMELMIDTDNHNHYYLKDAWLLFSRLNDTQSQLLSDLLHSLAITDDYFHPYDPDTDPDNQ